VYFFSPHRHSSYQQQLPSHPVKYYVLSEIQSSRHFPQHVFPSGVHIGPTEKTFIIPSPTTKFSTTLSLSLNLDHFSATIIFLRHLHQNSLYLLPTTPSMYTSHDFSITQHFTWFICSIGHRIHVAGTSSGNPTLLQFIRLFTFINTMLCLCTVLCCSQSGSPHVVGM